MPLAETTPLKPQTTTRTTRLLSSPQTSSMGIARRLSALFDAWCDVVAPCPWTATAGSRVMHARPAISSHP